LYNRNRSIRNEGSDSGNLRGAIKVVVFEKKLAQHSYKTLITGKGRCSIANSAPVKEFLDSFYFIFSYVFKC
jgi:predicted flavoprotein YhiN